MPTIRRLPVLIALVALAGSYTAFAGPDRVSYDHASVAGVERANGGESGSRVAQEQPKGQGAEDRQGADRIAQAIADEFGVSKDAVLASHNEGIGFGALFKLYKLARAKGIGVDELLASIPTDANGERAFSFGQLRKGLNDEQQAAFEAGPKNLGKLVSGTKKKHHQPKAETSSGGTETEGAGASGLVPPGQAKKSAKQ